MNLRIRPGFIQGLLALTALLLFLPAQAHEIRPAIIDLTVQEDETYNLQLRVNLEALMADISPEHSDTDESPNAATYNELRALPPAELSTRFNDFAPTLVRNIDLRADGERLTPNVEGADIPPVGDLDLARDSVIRLSGQIPAGTAQLSWFWAESYGANALRVNGPQGEEIHTVYLQAGDRAESIDITGATQSAGEIFVNYLVIGYEHILPKGLDHILFVVGLFLLSTRLSPLLWQITSFTLAHTVTLALGMLGIVNLSPSIVEPLIALSIVYVAVENIWSKDMTKWRPFVVFGFGLLHGLGFAGVLTEIGLSPSHFVTGLVAFNVGVELGQLSVIALCFLAVGIWFRNKTWYRSYITNPASLVIAVIAAYWVVERTVLA
ncbi:HupE/UreJ family protein [Saccharospirillum salsuginis]|uniref:Membrane protein n=1 Tax=Saccharospirillum salsuginis TaxID=418750 RepID=A0A918N6L4_9GAMM|nr:HupE/UreJ family protein [Saccharospirillum salsuginis]GGX40151.1 membrane protein [Saccharospirillum salsuginis]